jgi:hypothetical protein
MSSLMRVGNLCPLWADVRIDMGDWALIVMPSGGTHRRWSVPACILKMSWQMHDLIRSFENGVTCFGSLF